MWIGSGQFILLFSNLLLLKLIAGGLTIESFGLYSLLMSVILFIRQLIYDPFSMVIGKESALIGLGGVEISNYFQIARYILFRLALLIFLVGCIFAAATEILKINELVSAIIFFGALYLLSNGAHGVYVNILNTCGYRASAAKISIFDSVLKVLLVVIAINISKFNMANLLLAISFGSACTFMVVNLQVKKIENEIKLKLNSENFLIQKKEVIKIFFMCVPLLFPVLFGALKSVGDRWLLAAYMGVDELAAYFVLLQIGYLPVVMFFGVLQTYIAPHVYLLSNLSIFERGLKIRSMVLGCMISMLVFIFLFKIFCVYFADVIFIFLLDSKYNSYSSYLFWVMIAGALGSIASFFQLIVFALYDSRVASKIITYSIGAGLLIVFLFISIFSFPGAIMGLIGASLLSCLIFILSISIKNK